MDNNEQQNSSVDLSNPSIQWGSQPTGNSEVAQNNNTSIDLSNPEIQWGDTNHQGPLSKMSDALEGSHNKVLSSIGGAASGAVKGAANSFLDLSQMGNSIREMEHKYLPSWMNGPNISGGSDASNRNYVQNLQNQTQTHGTAENVGSGIESLAEFVMGDEVLKGLSLADKLSKVAPVVKTLENFPKLAQALRLGINVGKAGAELSPEERALLQKYPVMARLVGAGLDAVRAGTVQTAQTGVKTGNIKQAVKEGAETAAGAGVVGGAAGVAGGLLAKGGKAAKTIEDLTARASNGPTDEEAGDKLADLVKTKTQLTVDEATQNLNEANSNLEIGNQKIKNIAEGAPENSAITAQAQKAAQIAHDALGTNYQKAAESVKDALKGTTVEYGGSPLHEAAQELLQGGKVADEENPLNAPLKVTNPGSPQVNDLVTKLADEEGTFSINDEGEPTKLTANNLLDTAKNIKERLRKVGWATSQDRADRDVYFKLLDGVHDTLQQLAEKSGNPEAMTTVKTMNSDYKNGIDLFKNSDVKALLEGNTNDVAKRLLGGATSLADLKTTRQALGDDAFKSVMNSSLKRIAADATDKTTGEFSFNKFLTKWNSIPAEVRSEAFKDSLTGNTLQDAVTQAQKIHASGVIPEANAKLKDVADTVQRLIGNGDTSALVKDTQRVKDLGETLGPDGMSQLGKTILDNQLKQAATTGEGITGNVDTGKFLNWVKTLKDSPEVVDSLFKPTPESEAAYNKVVQDASQAQNVKNAIKFGVITPAVIGVGATVGHTMGSALLGALAAGAGESSAKSILEKIANSPQMWNSLKWLNEKAGSEAASKVGTAAKYGAGRIINAGINAVTKKNAYDGASSLGSQ